MVNIDSNETYNITFIASNGLFGTESLSTVTKLILKDKCRGNILDADFIGEATRTVWFISGENLLKYLNEKNEEIKERGKKNHKK